MTPGRSDERAQFAASLHDMLTNAEVPAAARRWAAGDRAPGLAVWRGLAALGVTSLAVPERDGGLGASLADVVVACEELGHHAVPGPVAESVAAVPVLLAALSADATAGDLAGGNLAGGNLGGGNLAGGNLAEGELAAGDLAAGDLGGGGWPVPWLAGLAAGELIATAAMPPWLPWAVDAGAAGLVLLAAGDTVRLAAPGAQYRSVDPGRSLSEVTGGQALARGAAVAGAVARALDAGALASAAQLLGAGRALLEASVRHAGQRAQFGRPIGAFQAVKHQLADVAIGLEFAGPLLDAAAGAFDSGSWHTARDVSAAKVACTAAARQAARTALQVHGAIGYTEEHDLHLWLLKVRALAGAWGSQSEHRARVMAAISVSADGTSADREPTVEPPTVEPPTVEPPTVEPPTVEPPTVEPPTVERPPASSLTAPQPIDEQPTAGQPTAGQPTAGQPTAERPAATGEPAWN
jgi:alkylation response protein AidB-like acyl-CoA dehydrogenase